MNAPQQTTVGKYRLLRKLATGGMAEVYLAQAAGPAGFQKTVVLKRILPHLAEDAQFVEMFLNEARLAALLNHPNIVQIFELGEAAGSYFIAMEHIDGPNLRGLGRKANEAGRPIAFEHAAKIISLACEGLGYAHDFSDNGTPLDLIHRDISPDNIMVSRSGAVKVVDFGIAKAANQAHLTKTGTLKGKLAYMPPEQLRGKPLDRRADVFALGVTLYELTAGMKPFEATSEVAAMQAILHEPPTPLSQRRSDCPPELEAIVDRALAKDREARYPDCRSMQQDLERFLMKAGVIVGAFELSQLVNGLAPARPVPPQATPLPPSVPPEIGGLEPVVELTHKKKPGPSPQGREDQPTVVDGGAGVAEAFTDLRPGRAPQAQPPVAPPPPRTSLLVPALAGAALLMAAGAGGAYFALRGNGPAEDRGVQVQPPAASAAQPAPQATDKPSAPGQPVQVPQPAVAAVAAAPAEPPQPQLPPQPPVEPDPGASAAQPAPAAVATAQPETAPKSGGMPKPLPATPTIEQAFAAALPGQKEPVPAAASPAPATAPAPAPTPAPAAQAEATLAIDSDPPCKVTVDGKGVGTTPVELRGVSAGEHDVRLTNGELGLERRLSVAVAAGETKREKVRFQTGTLSFRVQPWANVEIDGKPRGVTPLKLELYEGEHSVRLTNPDEKIDVVRKVWISPGKEEVIKGNLAE